MASSSAAATTQAAPTVLEVFRANLCHAFEYDVAQIAEEEAARRNRRTVRILLIRFVHPLLPSHPPSAHPHPHPHTIATTSHVLYIYGLNSHAQSAANERPHEIGGRQNSAPLSTVGMASASHPSMRSSAVLCTPAHV